MQSASARFFQRADASMRPIGSALLVSFARELIEDAEFFTVGISTIGGDDIIKGDDNVLQLWDKYQYRDFSDQVVSVEWSQAMDPLYSVQCAIGDMVLNNSDNYFSATNMMLPYRPVRLLCGFGNKMTGDTELLPQFVGVTEKAPTVDETAKTVSYHLIDFMSTIYNRDLSRSVMLVNVRSDQALSVLLQLIGLSPTQYDLDVGFNIIPFLYFEATAKFGDAAQQIMQAEMGRLYMSETGRITFKNRQNYASNPVWEFSFAKHNVIDYTTNTEDDLINRVEITSNFKVVQPDQPYWESQAAVSIQPGSSEDIWANFNDPVVSVDTPLYVDDALTSSYTTSTTNDGSGTPVTSGVSVSVERFGTSYLMTYTNGTADTVWITNIKLYASPAVATQKPLVVVEQDEASVLQYDEHILKISNDFFADRETMVSAAKLILAMKSTYGALATITVKGNPALQINDTIKVAVRKNTYIAAQSDTLTSIATQYAIDLSTIESLNPDYGPIETLPVGTKVNLGVIPELCTIIGKASKLAPSMQQILTVKPLVANSYFTVGISTIGGTDLIAP